MKKLRKWFVRRLACRLAELLAAGLGETLKGTVEAAVVGYLNRHDPVAGAVDGISKAVAHRLNRLDEFAAAVDRLEKTSVTIRRAALIFAKHQNPDNEALQQAIRGEDRG